MISLTLFGAIMFFLLWEANKKYNICFMNLLYLLMSDGISRFYRLVEYDRKKRKSSNVSWHRRVRYLLIFVPALVITIFMSSFRQFFIYDYNDYRKVIIEDVCNKEEYISLKNKGDVVEQTFVTGKSFNEFRILYKNSTKLNAGDYWIELLDEKDNIIVVKTLPKIKKGTKRWFDFDLDDIPSSGDKQQYKIRILCMKNQNKGIQLAVTPHDSYDFYSSGKLMLNSKSHKRDLAFCVSQKVKCGRLGKSAYIVLLILVWILSGIFFLWENSGKRN